MFFFVHIHIHEWRRRPGWIFDYDNTGERWRNFGNDQRINQSSRFRFMKSMSQSFDVIEYFFEKNIQIWKYWVVEWHELEHTRIIEIVTKTLTLSFIKEFLCDYQNHTTEYKWKRRRHDRKEKKQTASDMRSAPYARVHGQRGKNIAFYLQPLVSFVRCLCVRVFPCCSTKGFLQFSKKKKSEEKEHKKWMFLVYDDVMLTLWNIMFSFCGD